MSGQDLQSILYEISAVIILFIFFYILLSTMAIFRLRELNSFPDTHKIALCFYILLFLLCIFRVSTMIYLIAFTLQIPDADHIGSYELNIFFLVFPDCMFWGGMACFFWVVILFFYSSHMTNEDLTHLNYGLKRYKIHLRSQLFFWFFIILYTIIQIAIVGNYFTENLGFRVYASVQAGCSVVIPLLVSFFIHRMYKNFSGVFYVSDEWKKLSRMGVKTMMIILALRFVAGLIDLSLLQTKARNLISISGDSFNYYALLSGLAILAVSAFFLEILPIYIGFHLRVIKLCFKINKDGRIRDSPELRHERESLIPHENKTSLENEVIINGRKDTLKTDKLIIPEKISENLKKFEFSDLNFSADPPINNKKKFGIVQFANTSTIFDSSTNSRTYELCVRTVEIPAMNRFLLEDVEKDLNKHIFLQNKLKNKMVNLFGFAIDKENISFIYENMKNGSLKSLLASSPQKGLSFPIRMKILLDLAKTMADLHSFNIVHGHLSPNNILFDSEFNLKVGDLLLYGLKKYTGYSKGYSNKSKYTAPEYLKDNGFIAINPTNSGDCYSFAIISWEVLTGDVAFRNVTKSELKKILIEENSRPKIPEVFAPDLAKLIRCCWQSDAGKRPSFSQIINNLQELEKNIN